MTNSRRKGAEGEREASRWFNEKGYSTRRGVQYRGGPDSPDVIGLDHIHLEIKRVEKLNVHDAMDQSKRDAAEDEIPIVMHRKNRKPWLITMDANDFMEFYDAYIQRLSDKKTERGM